jgi:hypothetical protein
MSNSIFKILSNAIGKHSKLSTDVQKKLFDHSVTAMHNSDDASHIEIKIALLTEVQTSNPEFLNSDSLVNIVIPDKNPTDAGTLDFTSDRSQSPTVDPNAQVTINSNALDFTITENINQNPPYTDASDSNQPVASGLNAPVATNANALDFTDL